MKASSLYVFGIIAVVLACVSMPHLAVRSEVAWDNKNLFGAITLAKACKGYALDHGGKVPEHLSDPAIIEDVTPERWEELLYRDQKTKRQMEWLYFPPTSLTNPKPDEIMIASPISNDGRRVVVFSDMSGKVIKNKDFEAQYPAAKFQP